MNMGIHMNGYRFLRMYTHLAAHDTSRHTADLAASLKPSPKTTSTRLRLPLECATSAWTSFGAGRWTLSTTRTLRREK